MHNSLPLKIKLALAGLVIIILLTIFVALSTPPLDQDQDQDQSLIPSSTPISTPNSPLPLQDPEYNGPEPESIYQTPLPELEQAVKINELNGLLLEKLPYVGNNFSLSYDGVTNSFVAVFTEGSEEQGESEMLEFLKLNNIESTDWLKNFKTETE